MNESAYQQLTTHWKEANLLGSCASVLGWDERTYMPKAGADLRGEQMALLARMVHEQTTSPHIGELLNEAENDSSLKNGDSREAANVREIRRAYDRSVKLPESLVMEIARVSIQAQQVWQQAREDDDFSLFQPWLEKIVHLKRQEVDAVGYPDDGVPYDALLDEYEPGATTADVTAVFAELREALVPLIEAIQSSGRKAPSEIITREYPVEQQANFSQKAAAAIGFDLQAGRIDTTTHPFCSGMGPGDCRITTRYDPHHFSQAFFGILHEAGHGIYEQGLSKDDFGLPTGTACSLGIHESQSRLWENQVGRGRPFWEHFFPQAQQVFPGSLSDVSLDDFYFAINESVPSFIRVEADETTYNLHIILRFELEQAMIAGDLSVADVPGAWNEKCQKLLGLTPKSNAEGCLQDIHWSGGGIGYFPTYTLGNLYAAQLMEKAREDLGDIDQDFRDGQFLRLKDWLNKHVHQPGLQWRANELCERITGKLLSPKPLMDYLKGKYQPLYNL